MSDNRMNKLTKTKFDCFCNRHAICPYCGYEDEDSWEYKEGENDAECPSCGEPFTVIAELVAEYTTSPIGGWPDER